MINTQSPFSTCAAQLREFIQRQSAPFSDSSSSHRETNLGFSQLALPLFALQFTRNAPYRQFCEARKITPQSVREWREIPAVPASSFKEYDLTSLPPAERIHVFHSSGTTGQRASRHFHNAESLAIYEASLLPWFRANVFFQPGCEKGQGRGTDDPQLPQFQFLSLTPPAVQAPHSSLVHMIETIFREFAMPGAAFTGNVQADGTWDLDLNQIITQLRESVISRRPVALLGTAFNFMHLLDHLNSNQLQFQLPAGSRVLETGGYKGRSRTLPKPELHDLITESLGIPASRIVCEYGMSELGSQAYDSNGAPNSPCRFRFPPWARSQIISPETGREVADGETGLIRVFDLANLRSAMAIQTEDLGVRKGDGFELLGRATLSEPRGCSLMSS